MVEQKNTNIREIPNLEKNEFLGILEEIARTAPLMAPVLKELTDSFIDAGYTEDQALRLTAYIVYANK